MSIRKDGEADFPTRFGRFRIISFVEDNKKTHIVLIKSNGRPDDGSAFVRIHSRCLTGDTFCSLRCDCREQLEQALELIRKKGTGILIYLDQEGRGIGLANKIKAYALQDQGMDTVEANEKLGFKEDERNYGVAAAILKMMGVQKVQLITNNPEKISEIEKHGIIVEGRMPLVIEPTEYNARYLKTKKEKMGHLF
jgi:GTP cyclohydrolase II